MPVNLDDVIAGQLAKSFALRGDAAAAVNQTMSQGSANYLNTLDRVMLREFTEPSFVEAAAMKEAKANPDAQYAMGMRTVRIVPEPDK